MNAVVFRIIDVVQRVRPIVPIRETGEEAGRRAEEMNLLLKRNVEEK